MSRVGIDRQRRALDPAGRPRARVREAEVARSGPSGRDHPGPRSPVAALTPYRPAFDITGADIFPIAYPPEQHSDLPNVQEPPPPPIQPSRQAFRSVAAANGTFRDWFGPHDAHVYRFAV